MTFQVVSPLVCDRPQEAVLPHQFDLLVSEVKEGTLEQEVSKAMGIQYLSTALQSSVSEVGTHAWRALPMCAAVTWANGRQLSVGTTMGMPL